MENSILNPKFEQQAASVETGDNQTDFRELMFHYVIYWPLLLFLILLGGVGAWLYLRYTPKVYSSAALLAITRDSKMQGGGGDNNIRISLTDEKLNLERELELMQSPEVMGEVVKRLHLYGELTSKGRVYESVLFGNDAPLVYEAQNPDGINKTLKLPIRLDQAGDKVFLDEKPFPVNQWVNTPFGIGRFQINKKVKPSTELYLTVRPIRLAVGSLLYKVSAETKSRSSELIYLNMNDFHQQRATEILDSLVKVYDEFTVDFKKQSYLNSAQFITDRLSIVERELSGVEQEVQNFRSANQAIDLGSQSSAYLESVQQSDQQLAEINLQLELVQKAQSYLASRNSSADPLPALVNLGDPTIASQMGQLFQAESELRRLMQLSGPENPRVLALQQQIGQLRPAIMEGINNYKNNLQTSRDFYNRKAAGFNSMLKSIPQKEKGLLDITRQQNIKNAVFSYLLQKREESAIAVAATTSNTQFLRRPDAMGLVKPKPVSIYSIFIAASLFLFALFVFIRELLHNKFESRREVERQLQAPIVGEVLQFDGEAALDGSESIVVGPGSRTVVAEQFREIRTNLRYIGLEGNKKVLLVTSSAPGEGKTFVAINTAVSFSLSNKKVVLLGFDLRKPKLAKELGIENTPGLSNYLVGQVEIPEICKKLVGFDNLTVIPSGTIPPNPSELLLHERMQVMMEYLKKEFDVVVIDSPPIGSVTDAKLLAYHADVTLYIMRQLYTPRSFFPMIRDAYREKRLPNMALVLNGIRRRKFMGYSYGSYGGYGGYGSHYGYGYGYTEEPGSGKKKKSKRKKITE